jgi:plastocyanin
MYFSRSFVVSALVGLGAATTHAGEMGMNATGAAGLSASETLASTGMASATGAAAAPEGMVATHVVQVGGPNGSLIFTPENVKANVGDLVQFQFYPKVRLS